MAKQSRLPNSELESEELILDVWEKREQGQG
jgi:hypothetical protein